MNTTRTSAFAAAAALTLGALGSSAALAQTAPAPAPTKVYDGTTLTGLNGVTVGGQLYDVRFAGGQSCAQAFSGCDSASDFTFSTLADAKLATSALGSAVDYKDFGAGSTYQVSVYTPYGQPNASVNSWAIVFYNMGSYEPTEQGFPYAIGSALQDSSSLFARYAVWTPSVSAVPEPGTWALMAAGLGAVGFMARRRPSA